jgi:hypothetical protein
MWLEESKNFRKISFTPKDNGHKWSTYSSKISQKIPAGEYKFHIYNGPKGIAIDNIKIYTNETASSSKIKVEAGADSTISLPTNTFNLNSTITNPDSETISSVVWSKINGGGVTFSNANSEKTKISNLQNGEYTFKVTVTNSEGDTIEDTVKITVDNSKILYGFTFEENTDGFTPLNNGLNLSNSNYSRDLNVNFPLINDFNYTGNDTYFIGMGQYSYYYSSTSKSINLSKKYNANELGLQFNYKTVDPWDDASQNKITVILKSDSGSEIASFTSQDDSKSWLILNSTINKELPAGNYTLEINHAGTLTAVDDIYLFEK